MRNWIKITLATLGVFLLGLMLLLCLYAGVSDQINFNEAKKIAESGGAVNHTGFSFYEDYSIVHKERGCQDWEKDIEYYCDDINNDGLTQSDCIRNKCYVKDENSEGGKK